MGHLAADRVNRARGVAADRFSALLRQLRGQAVSERSFARHWSEAIGSDEAVLAAGWYDPPPGGVAVLSGLDRISFDTLRAERHWPGDRHIDWRSGALYGYCSPVNAVDGVPGDFAVTLYFGTDPRVREHFIAAHRVTRAVVNLARRCESAKRLFVEAEAMFADAGFRNCVVSITDSTPLDLGHTLGAVRGGLRAPLASAQRERIRHERRFVNGTSDWSLADCGPFTVEPQLVSTSHPDLPQVSFHYVVVPATGEVLDEPDAILAEHGLRS